MDIHLDMNLVITVAMKLPVDLTDEMSGEMEQASKIGSLAFLCTIMVNLMPSLASIDNKTLLANVI
nr:phosphoglucosamine mutase [Tanacetum cinerariifolium]